MFKAYQKHIIAIILVFLLMAIRFFEKSYFDDGLICFFQHDYLTEPLPKLSIIKIIWIDSIRFWLNTAISILILSLYFNQSGLLKFLLLVFTISYLASILVLYLSLNNYQAGHYLVLFYNRRFLIQPLLLLLLVPALWYQEMHRANHKE